MRAIEWVFPISGCIRRRRDVAGWRAGLTAVAAIVVQWVSVQVMLAVSSTAHVPLGRKILWGLRSAADVFSRQWLSDSEWVVLTLLFFGGVFAAAAIEWTWALLLLRRRLRRGRGVPWRLMKFIMLGMQTWALYWMSYTVWLMLGGWGIELLFGLMIVPPAAIILITTLQAAGAARIVCGGRPETPSGGKAPPVGLGAGLPWKRHLCIFFGSAGAIAGALLLSVLIFRPGTPPASWPAAERVSALLAEANTPKSWIERNLNIFPYRREQDEITNDLVDIGSPAVDPLIAALRDQKLKGGLYPAAARRLAATALGSLGDKRAVGPLIEALTAPEPLVRASSAWALGQLGDARATGPLIAVLSDERWDIRDSAVGALVKLGPVAVEPFIGVLKDKDPDRRASAAKGLGCLGDKRAVEPLIAALKDQEHGVRSMAAWALGKLGDKRAVQPLTAALADDSREVRTGATDALVKIGPPSIEPFVVALANGSDNLRAAAANVLRRLSDTSAVQPLINALNDEDGEVRCSAAAALGDLGDGRAIEPLKRALRDTDEKVRRAASVALSSIRYRLSEKR